MRDYEPRDAVARGVEVARRTYARVDDHGDDGLGTVRTSVHGGGGSWFNRITRRVMVGVGGPEATSADGRLVTVATTAHEVSHKWFDTRAGFGGLLYGGSPGRLSEGLAQVMSGASLALEGDTAEQARGWKELDPRGQTTPMSKLGRGRIDVPLSVTMDDVRRAGFTFTDNGYVHVHSGVVQAAHLDMARDLGMETMARITTQSARRELTPTTGIARWAAATLRTAEQLHGSTAADAVHAAWTAARVALPR
jgi:hypothetical protein